MLEQLVGVLDERRQQLELERRQLDGALAHGQAALAEVHGQERIAVRLLQLASGGAAQNAFDPGEQLLPPERLRHVVVGTGTERTHLLQLLAAGAQHHHGHIAQLANALEGRPAVEIGHVDVEHHEIGALAVERLQRRAPV